MNLIGNFLIVISLGAGALAAASAYHVPLDLPADEYRAADGRPLTIKSSAGVVLFKDEATFEQVRREVLKSGKIANPSLEYRALLRAPPEKLKKATFDQASGLVLLPDGLPVPLAENGDELTEQLRAQLQQQATSADARIRQEYVTVKEFSFSRWPGRWVFLSSVAGLLLGAFLVRSAARRAIAIAGASARQQGGPELALRETRSMVQTLRRVEARQKTAMTSDQKVEHMQNILEKISHVQKTHLDQFIEARPQLIARMGLGGYAELMDRYAAFERQLNRAWSAAADLYYDEAVTCLDNAEELLDAALERLQRG